MQDAIDAPLIPNPNHNFARAAATRMGITQAELAARLRVSKRTMSQWSTTCASRNPLARVVLMAIANGEWAPR